MVPARSPVQHSRRTPSLLAPALAERQSVAGVAGAPGGTNGKPPASSAGARHRGTRDGSPTPAQTVEATATASERKCGFQSPGRPIEREWSHPGGNNSRIVVDRKRARSGALAASVTSGSTACSGIQRNCLCRSCYGRAEAVDAALRSTHAPATRSGVLVLPSERVPDN